MSTFQTVSLTFPPFSVSHPQSVPITIIRGATKPQLPLWPGENAALGDIHSVPAGPNAFVTSGFYRIVKGASRPGNYSEYSESKLVLRGEISIKDLSDGKVHECVAGDYIMLPLGSKVEFNSKSEGFAFYVVTRKFTHAYGARGKL